MVSTADIETVMLELLGKRAEGATICPSEVARCLVKDQMAHDYEDHWRELMDPVREVARSLMRAGVIDITQRGSPVDPDCFKGPVRLRLKGFQK